MLLHSQYLVAFWIELIEARKDVLEATVSFIQKVTNYLLQVK